MLTEELGDEALGVCGMAPNGTRDEFNICAKSNTGLYQVKRKFLGETTADVPIPGDYLSIRSPHEEDR